MTTDRSGTTEFLEEYEIFEDSHASAIAMRIQSKGHLCLAKTRQELVKCLHKIWDTAKKRDMKIINTELFLYRHDWIEECTGKMTTEELKKFRKIMRNRQ